MEIKLSKRINIAIFASGGGSNAEAIIQHFSELSLGRIALIVTNNPSAGILDRAKKHQIESFVHSKDAESDESLINLMEEHGIDFIVLAGYLRKINPALVDAFDKRMVNIHPALLPRFGGKGMYGMNVHRAVVEAKETVSGPTIHYVNNNYDEGGIIEQHKCQLSENDTPDEVQKKVLTLEHKYYPLVVERLISEL
jgi:phosphoribosylglycinamide formyltransferase-1